MNVLKIMLIFSLLLFSTITVFAQEGKIGLLWESAEDAVMYEVEVATIPLLGTRKPSLEQTLYRTTEVFTPGIELDMSLFKKENLDHVYYRVRPLNLDKEPIAPFSYPIALSETVMNPTKPQPTAFFNNHRPVPLYPVYSWIPVLGATGYEVEITNQWPENPNGTEPSQYRIRSYSVQEGFDCYDTYAYTEAGNYYWRVIALDAQRAPIGNYSDGIPFRIKTDNTRWAVFGDSITHGGGAISNPPSDERFDYSSYVPLHIRNLGKSGDTVEMMVDRFDADVLPFNPKYMFILGGSNSIRGGVSGESVIASLQTIKEKCADNDIIPIFLTLPPVNPERIQRVFNQLTADNWQIELKKVNDFIRNQPNAVEIYSLLVDEKGFLPIKYAEDGLHPDISGKKIMATSITDFLGNHMF